MSINTMERPILFMDPFFKENIWGGTTLNEKYGYNLPGDSVGECWAISAYENGSSVVREGKFKGKTLKELYETEPYLFGNISDSDKRGKKYTKFPLLVKIISAKEDLSIQVHPDDEYAGKNENGSLGKTECWYVLDCDEDSSLVIGHNAKTKEELVDMIEGGKWDNLISKVSVKPGDFIQIDPGTVHSISGGMLILETQQNSDITYRVYDYNRVQADGTYRDLHIKQSIDVITVPARNSSELIKNYSDIPKNELVEMISCDYYTIWKAHITKPVTFVMDKPFMNVSVIEGDGLVNGQYIKKGDHFVLPSGIGEVDLQGDVTIIVSSLTN